MPRQLVLMPGVGGTTPAILGFGALTAVVMGAYDYTGGALTGYKQDREVDEFERKEALRKNRRRPIEQTISELGEGRGTLHLQSVHTRADSPLQESMVRVTMSDGECGSRKSMGSMYPQSHKPFIISDPEEALFGCTYV
jgi:hypothetical protein